MQLLRPQGCKGGTKLLDAVMVLNEAERFTSTGIVDQCGCKRELLGTDGEATMAWRYDHVTVLILPWANSTLMVRLEEKSD